MLIANSRIFRAAVVDKMKHKSEERLVMTEPANSSASSRNSLIGGSRGECQTVTRDDVDPEVAASSSQNTSFGSNIFPRISGLLQVLPDQREF